jgi:hypothetical protein
MSRVFNGNSIPNNVKKGLRKLSRIWNKRQEAKLLIVELHDAGISFSQIGKAIGLTKPAVRKIYLQSKGGDVRD